MLSSLTKLFVASLRLISTFCRLLTTFGCYPSTSIDSNGVHSKQHQNGHCNGNNGTIVTNGKSHITNGTATKVLNGTISNGTSAKNGHILHYDDQLPYSNGHAGNGHLPSRITTAPMTTRTQVTMYIIVSNYLCHGTLILFGHLNDLLRRHGWLQSFERVERNRDGYPGLYSSFATFYIRNIIQRLINMWCHPIGSVPGAVIDILERKFGPYNVSWKLVSTKLCACDHVANCNSRFFAII